MLTLVGPPGAPPAQNFPKVYVLGLPGCGPPLVISVRLPCNGKPGAGPAVARQLFAPLSCNQAVRGLRLAGPALSFAKPPSDQNHDKQNASRCRADLARLIARISVHRTCRSDFLAGRG